MLTIEVKKVVEEKVEYVVENVVKEKVEHIEEKVEEKVVEVVPVKAVEFITPCPCGTRITQEDANDQPFCLNCYTIFNGDHVDFRLYLVSNLFSIYDAYLAYLFITTNASDVYYHMTFTFILEYVLTDCILNKYYPDDKIYSNYVPIRNRSIYDNFCSWTAFFNIINWIIILSKNIIGVKNITNKLYSIYNYEKNLKNFFGIVEIVYKSTTTIEEFIKFFLFICLTYCLSSLVVNKSHVTNINFKLDYNYLLVTLGCIFVYFTF